MDPASPTSGSRTHHYRVIFGDTDQMGVVYYANYFRIFEGARADYWRQLGRSHHDLVAWDCALPVIEAHCDYKQSSRYEDLLAVETWVSELRGASLRFAYRITRVGSALIATGYTRHAVLGATGRPRAIPRELREAIPVPTA